VLTLLFIAASTDIFAAPGDLDTTFGNGGKVVSNLPDINTPRQVGIQPDGKIVALGWSRNSSGNLLGTYLVRYNQNGTLDASFGRDGEVRVNCYSDTGVLKMVLSSSRTAKF
jgi:uncharacterized delta-60 repeat protein